MLDAPQVKGTPISLFVPDHQYVIVEDSRQRGAFKVVYQLGVESSFCGQPRWHWTTIRTVVAGLDRAGAESVSDELNRAAW